MSEPSWIVFDLDETIVDHDTFSKFLVQLLRRDPWRAAAAVLALPVAGPLTLTRRWKALGASMLLWIATVGVSSVRLEQLIDTYVTELDVRSRCFPEALSEIQTHLTNGHRVAVVTACADILALPICREIDPRITVNGSTLTRRGAGLVAAQHCYGAGKVEYLRALDGRIAAAYSDSRSDLPMLTLADDIVLVNANPKLQRTVRAAVAEDRRIRCVTWGNQ